MCSKKIQDGFVAHAKTILQEWYGNDWQSSSDLVRIVNKNHFNRISKLMETTKGNIVIGGDKDEDDLWIAPTIVGRQCHTYIFRRQ